MPLHLPFMGTHCLKVSLWFPVAAGCILRIACIPAVLCIFTCVGIRCTIILRILWIHAGGFALGICTAGFALSVRTPCFTLGVRAAGFALSVWTAGFILGVHAFWWFCIFHIVCISSHGHSLLFLYFYYIVIVPINFQIMYCNFLEIIL